MCSYILKHARTVAPEIFGLPVEFFMAGCNDTECPQLTSLAHFPNTTTFSKFAPILYPLTVWKLGQAVQDKIFMAPEIAKVCMFICWFESSTLKIQFW